MDNRFRKAYDFVLQLVKAGHSGFPFPELETEQVSSYILQDDTENRCEFLYNNQDQFLSIVARTLKTNSASAKSDLAEFIVNEAVTYYYDDIKWLHKLAIDEVEAGKEEECRRLNHPHTSHEEWEYGGAR